jgi:Amidohydrolase family
VLDAFDAAGVLACERPVLTHCQVLDSELIERMATGGVIANVQPSFVPTDMRWVQQRLSPVQLQYSYAWKVRIMLISPTQVQTVQLPRPLLHSLLPPIQTLLDRGVCVAGGSDAPIETCSPLVGMFDAIHRQARSPPASVEASRSSDLEGSTACSEPDVFRPEESLSFSEALWIYTVGAAYALQDNFLLRTTKPKMVVVGGQVLFSEENFLTSLTESEYPKTTESAVPLCGAAAMGGPYVPGKNGKRSYALPKKMKGEEIDGDIGVGRFVGGICACRLLGKYCAVAYS